MDEGVYSENHERIGGRNIVMEGVCRFNFLFYMFLGESV